MLDAYMCGTFRNYTKQWPSPVSVFRDALYVAVMACRDIFPPITQVHTCGSFTFMVIQIMKLSIQEILRWEQWTQLPPAACEMGWYSLRQMGKAAVGQQSNHIHLTRGRFPCPRLLQQLINRLREPGIITLWANISTNAHLHDPRGPIQAHNVPLTPDHLHTRGFSLPSHAILRAQMLAGRVGQVIPANVLTCVLANQADYSSWFIQNSQDSPFKLNILAACADINHAKMDSERLWRVDRLGCMCNMMA